MIDSPRYDKALAKGIAAHGGLAFVFLTHRNDVAEAQRWAEAFGARRIIHEADLVAQPGAEIVLRGEGPWTLPGSYGTDSFRILFTPGHTQGCISLLHEAAGVLFTGDHLAARGAWHESDDSSSPRRQERSPFTARTTGTASICSYAPWRRSAACRSRASCQGMGAARSSPVSQTRMPRWRRCWRRRRPHHRRRDRSFARLKGDFLRGE